MGDALGTCVGKLSVSVLHNHRRRSSFAWKYFGDLIRYEGGKKKILNSELVYCSVCLDAVKAQSDELLFGVAKVKSYNRKVGTGNLIRHLRDDHKMTDIEIKMFKSKQKQNKSTSSDSSSQNTQDHDKMLARDIALWFCKSLLPFDSICDKGMMDFFMKYDIISSDMQLPPPVYVVKYVLDDVYESLLTSVKDYISQQTTHNMALTFDFWSDQNRRNYITFTLHYLTNDFELKMFTLSTKQLGEEKESNYIEQVLKEVLNDFNLSEKNIYGVVGPAGAICKAVSQANMKHHPCFGYGLHNLIILDGINQVSEIKALIHKSKQLVKCLRYSLPDLDSSADELQKDFMEALDTVNSILESDENDPIPIDLADAIKVETDNKDNLSLLSISSLIPLITSTSPTRWNSILALVESLLHAYHNLPIHQTLEDIGRAELQMTANELSLLEELLTFLRKFCVVIEILSCKKTCNINVALVFRSEVIDILSQNSEESPAMIQLKQNMLANIDKRFPVTSIAVAAALLDCRFMGIKEVDSYLQVNNLTRTTFLASYIKENVYVFDIPQIKQEIEDVTITAISDETSFLHKLSIKHRANANLGQESIQNDPIDQECWKYIASVDPTEPKDGNLLSYWNNQKYAFPRLATLANSVLCVPATSLPSDRMFSAAGLTFSDKRLRLRPRELNKVIFVHDNHKLCATDESIPGTQE